MEILILSAFAIASLVELARALPWSKATKAKKPLSCDACMVFWMSWPVLGPMYGSGSWLFRLTLGSAISGAAMLLLAILSYLRGPTSGPPEL